MSSIITTSDIEVIGNACLSTYNIDKSNIMLELFERYQSGESSYANPKYIELQYACHTVYFNIEGHYAQAIFLKCSLDKKKWVTLHSESDH